MESNGTDDNYSFTRLSLTRKITAFVSCSKTWHDLLNQTSSCHLQYDPRLCGAKAEPQNCVGSRWVKPNLPNKIHLLYQHLLNSLINTSSLFDQYKKRYKNDKLQRYRGLCVRLFLVWERALPPCVQLSQSLVQKWTWGDICWIWQK